MSVTVYTTGLGLMTTDKRRNAYACVCFVILFFSNPNHKMSHGELFARPA